MKRPRMPDQDVSNLQRDRLQRNLARIDGAQRFISSHPVCSGCNLDWAVLLINANETKAYDQHVRGQSQVRELRKQGTLIVDVRVLILRSNNMSIATPLISYR